MRCLLSDSAGHGKGAPESKPDPKATFKSLCRKLVRLLHPDGNAVHGPAELALWHDVQEAYQNGNFSWLEAIHARYELTVIHAENTIPVARIQDAIEEIRVAMRHANREVRELRIHPAWKFGSLAPQKLVKLEQRLGEDLQLLKRRLRHQLDSVNRVLEEFKTPPKPRGRKRNKKPAATPKPAQRQAAPKESPEKAGRGREQMTFF